MRFPSAQAIDVNYGKRPPYSLGIEEEFSSSTPRASSSSADRRRVAALEGDEVQAQ